MPISSSTSQHRPAEAMHDDLLRILGEIDERKVLDILSLHPTLADIEEAAMWTAGDGDVLAKAGHRLTGIAAQIFDILTADEEEPPC